jgi:hypothetical protein
MKLFVCVEWLLDDTNSTSYVILRRVTLNEGAGVAQSV